MTLTNYKLFAISPKAATNLVTNPSFETGTTGYTTGGTNTIAQSATQARRGVYSCKATYGNNDLMLSYAQTLTAVAYVGSMDVYIPTAYDGTELTLTWTDYAGSSVTAGKPDMTIRDKWQRISAYITPVGGDLVGTLTLSETGINGTAGIFVYVDGVQIETGTAATTYIDGDVEGNINTGNVLEYYWSGQENASTSVRTANTRAGGELVDISAYCKNILLEGLGVAPVDNVAVPLTSGGETYLYSNYLSRYFTLRVVFEGSHIGDIQAKRRALLNLIKPDVTGYPQPLVLRYQGYDDAGKLASEPVDIKCQYVSGLDTAPQMRFAHFADITFRLSDVALEVEGDTGAELELNAELTNADYIVYQDRDGVWHSMAGVTGVVLAIAQHPITKEIYIGGTGLNIGGDPDADCLAKWDESTQTWVVVTAGLTTEVRALCFDAVGNLYIGGFFTDAGDANGDRIVKWDGSTLSSLGTGAQGAGSYVYAIAIDGNGILYAGGTFTTMGGVANTARIAKWDGSVWTPLSTGISTVSVQALAIDNNNNVYIGGNFTDIGDANGDRIIMWTGTAFVSLSTGLDGVVYSLYFDDNGLLYLGGLFTNKFAIWNGIKFTYPIDNINSAVYSISKINNIIIFGGTFTTAGDISLLDRVAVYIGNGICRSLDINLPLTASVFDLFFDNRQNLYVGYNSAGTATVAGVTTVNNPSATSYPVLDFTGIGALQQVRNYNTGKAFFFNSLTLLSGEVITLDLRPDKLTMESNFRGNVKGYLVKGSNLDFPLIPGDNRIAVFMTGTDASAKGVIKYKTRLHGLDAAQYE
jgi:hypothetical protein